MRGAIPPLPHTPSWRGAQLKYMDFTFTFTFTFTIGSSRLKEFKSHEPKPLIGEA
jgi:hypothetical protein